MKKIYLPYLLLLMPVFVFAQADLPIIKGAWKKVPGIASSFKFNDHLGIIQVTLTDTSFELMAVDNKMSVLWRDSLKGCAVASGKFKDHILAISDSGYSNRKGNINPYYAFLIDPASGKIILQNQIFEQKAKDDEQTTAFFAADGSDFTLAVRQADISYSWIGSYKNKTQNLTLINLDEKLEPTYLKLNVPPKEDFVSMAMNKSGDLFLLTIIDQQRLQARRYEDGSTEPSEPITQACDDVDKIDLWGAANDIAPSETDRNILYLAIGHTNTEDDREMITAKFDFATHQVQTTTEVFTHKHVKEVEKSYVPVSNFLSASLGSAKKQMRVQYVATKDGKLITVSAEVYSVTVNNVQTFYGNALVISAYDSDLKRLYQQVMPVGYANGTPLTTGYALVANQLKIVSNSGYAPVIGLLDLSTGQWLKLAWINADESGSDEHVIWFADTFIVPYLHPRAFGSKFNIDLGLAAY